MSDLKIVQVLPMPNNATYQGAMFGLRSDGVVCEFIGQAWKPIIPNKFSDQSPVIGADERLMSAFKKLKDLAIQERRWRLEGEEELGNCEVEECIDMFSCKIDGLLKD